MKLGILAKRFGKVAADNSPAILTGLGVTGTLTAVFLTGKATFKAAEIISEAEANREYEGEPDLELKDKVELVWKYYVPAAGTTLLAIACMVAANHVGVRRAAALASAYNIAQRGFDEYKDKVVEKLGEQKEQKLRDELAQDRVTKNPPSKSTMIVTGTGEHLCKDEWSGRYFECEIETIKAAVNDINFQIIHQDYASLSDFYDLLQLPHTSQSDEMGWNNEKKLEVDYSYTSDDKGRPCLAFSFNVVPVRGYCHYF
jgi:hypothetical protein